VIVSQRSGALLVSRPCGATLTCAWQPALLHTLYFPEHRVAYVVQGRDAGRLPAPTLAQHCPL